MLRGQLHPPLGLGTLPSFLPSCSLSLWAVVSRWKGFLFTMVLIFMTHTNEKKKVIAPINTK